MTIGSVVIAGALKPASRAGPAGALGLQAPSSSPALQAVILSRAASNATLMSAAPRPAAGTPVYLISTTFPLDAALNFQVPPSIVACWADAGGLSTDAAITASAAPTAHS